MTSTASAASKTSMAPMAFVVLTALATSTAYLASFVFLSVKKQGQKQVIA
jgi:hypothetical protein